MPHVRAWPLLSVHAAVGAAAGDAVVAVGRPAVAAEVGAAGVASASETGGANGGAGGGPRGYLVEGYLFEVHGKIFRWLRHVWMSFSFSFINGPRVVRFH